MFRLSPLLLLLSGLATPLFAVTCIVPADRIEIERSSAIIVGRVLSSHVENSTRFGIETVTEVVLEEALKGNVGAVVEIHEPGGLLDGEARLIPGVPDLTAGDRVLLLLYQRDGGDYTISDLELGSFRFAGDVVSRNVDGWDLDGTPHKEPRRAAAGFVDYIRGVVRGEAVAEDYIVAAPLAGAAESMRTKNDGAFTASSYTVSLISGLGVRWNTFPSIVNWNKGNSQTGALGNGSTQINAAFNAWNAGGAHYALATSNANPNGIQEPSDAINNIVFEKDLTASGVQPYSCTQGGVLGMGGIHAAVGTHTFNGETFATTKEVDVSMNQGLGACTLAQFPTEAFNTTVTHEVGHSLGFRHSDQTRKQNAACVTDPSLECSNSAVMDHLIILGLNGHLQAWDSNAINAVYGNAQACTPPSITFQPAGSTITSGNPTQLSVIAAGTPPLTYQWYSGTSGNTSSPVIGGTTAVISVTPPVTTSYWVRVTGQCPPVADSGTATVTVNPAVCPAVTPGKPQSTQVNGGIQLSIGANGGNPFTYLWFEGPASGTGFPIGTGNPLFVNPSQTTTYWCRITNNCSNKADSSVVTVTIAVARRHAANH